MSLKRIGVFRGGKLPSAGVEVSKGEDGQRIVEGVKPFVDTAKKVPFGRMTELGWIAYSKEEREILASQIEATKQRGIKKIQNARAFAALPKEEQDKILAKKAVEKEKREAKKAEKGDSRPPHAKVRKIKPIFVEKRIIGAGKNWDPIPSPALQKFQTVKRDGKWVQVGADNLTAHIEAR